MTRLVSAENKKLVEIECLRCKKLRSIFDVMFIEQHWPWKPKYLCKFCILELAGYWPTLDKIPTRRTGWPS